MSDVIRDYYESIGVKAFIIDEKLNKLEKNNDIKMEFEYWIKNNSFLDRLNVEGSFASDIAAMSSYMNGEGAFMMLIELREYPEKAKKLIKNGFQIK